MFNSFFSIFAKITQRKVLLAYTAVFLIFFLFPVKFIPDYLALGQLPGKKDTLFRLLTMTISFSGIFLTVLLVAYNLYVKTIRRNTLEFITDNQWLRLAFSCFLGTLVFLGAGFFLMETNARGNDLTVMYLSYALTFCFIICLFPLAILSLQETVSLKRINKLLTRITESDLDELYQPSSNSIDSNVIEKNPVLMLKDISVNAIIDRDWLLPQAVLNKLYELLILPLSKESDGKRLYRNLYVWALYCHHIKREVVKHNDSVTGIVLLKINFQAQEHFIEKKVMNLRQNKIDSFLMDYIRIVIENNLFFEIQGYLLNNINKIIRSHYESLNYTDQELPTLEYWQEAAVKPEEIANGETLVKNYWFYLKRELMDLLFETTKTAIDVKRKNVYQNFGLHVQNLLDALTKAGNLTTSQKREAIAEVMHWAGNTADYAIEKGVFEGIDVVSHIQIVYWSKIHENLALEGLLRSTRTIRLLNKKEALSPVHINDYFMIARVLAGKNLSIDKFTEIVETILETTKTILESSSTSLATKNDFRYQLKWLYEGYIEKSPGFVLIRDKYKELLPSLLEGFQPNLYYFPE